MKITLELDIPDSKLPDLLALAGKTSVEKTENGPDTVMLTAKNLEDGAKAGHGYNAPQLAVFGINWPPEKGWKSALIGTEIPKADYERFLALKGATSREKPLDF